MLLSIDRFTRTKWEEEILGQYPVTVAAGYFLVQITSLLPLIADDSRVLLARVFAALASAVEHDADDVQVSGLVAPELIMVASTAIACLNMAVKLRAMTTSGSMKASLDKDAQNALTAFESVDVARDQQFTFNTARLGTNLVYGITLQ